MRNFVVGDIQGCYKGLRAGLTLVGFNPREDKLWAVGDLVARGPESLETLQYLQDLGPHFETVLGNHDLHLLAIAHGKGVVKAQDKLTSLLKHKQFASLIDWLKTKPLAIKPAPKHLISHAGLYPLWSFKQAISLSQEVSATLQSSQADKFFKHMYGNQPSLWCETLDGDDRLRFITNAFTRMRYLQGHHLELKSKCHPSSASANLSPWFCVPNPSLSHKKRVIFGHWAALMGQTNNAQFIGLDTGYVWGKQMTFYEIESKQLFSVSA